MVGPSGPDPCGENRERPAVTECTNPGPEPLSVALKCRGRLRVVNRSLGAEGPLVNRPELAERHNERDMRSP